MGWRGTGPPNLSREIKISGANGDREKTFTTVPFSADHEQNWHPYPVDTYTPASDTFCIEHVHSIPFHTKRETHMVKSEKAASVTGTTLMTTYECGRVSPAGVGPGSPSRDAVNWLPSRSSLSVETRRRYGWLRMVFPGTRLFRAPIW